MKLVTIGNGTVTFELTPTDCLLLHDNCVAAQLNDDVKSMNLSEALGTLLLCGAMLATADPHGVEDTWTIEAVREGWEAKNDKDREVVE